MTNVVEFKITAAATDTFSENHIDYPEFQCHKIMPIYCLYKYNIGIDNLLVDQSKTTYWLI